MTKFFNIRKTSQIINVLLGILLIFTITQCASYDFARREIQQGNLLPCSKIQKLKVGMSKNDVAILMGTSLISPTFNNDRWNYAYTWRKGNGPMIVRNAVLFFCNDKLTRIEHLP